MATRDGNMRKSIMSIIEKMSTDIAVDFLTTRNNRCSAIDVMEDFADAWLGGKTGTIRWEEIEYAEFVAIDLLGMNFTKRAMRTYENPDGTIQMGTVPHRTTMRFEYATTFEGEAVTRMAHL